MKKNVLIAFTSGADSTLLLELALKAGHDATVFYVTVENNKEKARIELEQTQKNYYPFGRKIQYIYFYKLYSKFDPK